MKLIIIEGGDRLGKSTIIKGLCEHFNYDNVTIRHFGKPPKGLSSKQVLKFQFNAFNKEEDLFFHMKFIHYNEYSYYPETMIWNRSHLGEYVYAQMFRGGDPKVLKSKLIEFEKYFTYHKKIYLITLTSDPEFFTSKEDGQSFSKTLEEKTKELNLFKEAHEFSTIPNKLLIKVDNDGVFRTKEEIFEEVKQFIQ